MKTMKHQPDRQEPCDRLSRWYCIRSGQKGSRHGTYAKQDHIDIEIDKLNNRQSGALLAMSRKQTWQTVISKCCISARFRSWLTPCWRRTKRQGGMFRKSAQCISKSKCGFLISARRDSWLTLFRRLRERVGSIFWNFRSALHFVFEIS